MGFKVDIDIDANDFDIKARSKRGMQYATIKLQGDVVARTPVDTGNLKGSITKKVIANNKYVTGTVGSNIDYAYYVSEGSGAHKNSTGSSEFVANIKDWARRHGIDQPWAVIKSIRKKGVKPTYFMRVTKTDEKNVFKAFNKGFSK